MKYRKLNLWIGAFSNQALVCENESSYTGNVDFQGKKPTLVFGFWKISNIFDFGRISKFVYIESSKYWTNKFYMRIHSLEF